MTYTLYHGDCLEVLPTLAGVDAVVTDPPYGMKKAAWDMDIVPVAAWLPLARKFGVVAVFTGVRGAYDYPKPDWLMSWVRLGSTQRCGKLGGFNNWEPILLYGVRRLENDVISVPNFPDREAAGHPTPKPLRLMRALIKRLTKPGDTILDPFMGSGSTGVAAIMEGRNFIGIELDARYYRIAERRIANAQPPLFVADAPAVSEPEQAAMFSQEAHP